MNRLTEKNTKFADILETMEFRKVEQLYNKLQQLEDLEEDLRVNLMPLFKALKQGYIYVKLEDEIIKKSVDMLNFEEGLRGGSFSKTEAVDNCLQCYQILNYLSDYGKSWALTEEELEEKASPATISKLNQIENIEKELDIDVVILFKALRNGFYYKKDNKIFYTRNIINVHKYLIEVKPIYSVKETTLETCYYGDSAGKEKPLMDGHYWDWKTSNTWSFEDYGKTWALTREELEKGE